MKDFVVIIPARHDPAAGRDCLLELGGIALLRHSVLAAQEADLSWIVVTSAAADVCARAVEWNAVTLQQPARLVKRGVTAEEVLQFVLARLPAVEPPPAYVVMLAPELPLRRSGRLRAACEKVLREEADCLFSCCQERPLLWRPSPGGLVPFYDPQKRHASAVFRSEPAWRRENGSIYICRRDGLLRYGNRLFGKIVTLDMDPEESLRSVGAAGLAACRAMFSQIRPTGSYLGVSAAEERRQGHE